MFTAVSPDAFFLAADCGRSSGDRQIPTVRRQPIHRHGEAFVYAFVVEGTMRSKLDDTPASTYRQGENWVEQPGAHHVLRENTSQSERAARAYSECVSGDV
jgi:hypothetical protein